MPKLSKISPSKKKYTQKNSWLPIDERLIPNIFHFSHVKGITRIFLEFEMAVSLVMVTITLVAVIFKIFNLK
jgi:hypothetical protein